MKFFDSDTVFILCLFAVIALTLGEPDILDGLIKRANTMECAK